MIELRNMAYSLNPYLPRVRMRAVLLVRQGWSMRRVARYTGYNVSTISRWANKAYPGYSTIIPTLNSRPHSFPNKIPDDVEEMIVKLRKKNRRCGQIIWHELNKKGISVGLSTVNRVLKRRGLIKKRSPWKRWHRTIERPLAQKPGDLVQIDTIHVGPHRPGRLYVYTLLDVFSRWAWAGVSLRINTYKSLRFVNNAQDNAVFRFSTVQSDHGQEFSAYFTENMQVRGLTHRHIRVRQPTDNAHLERFNRTIQEECLDRIPQTLNSYKKTISEYLCYYNNERSHLGINYLTPLEKINQALPRS